MKNLFENGNINVHEILNTLDIGIWMLEYSEKRNIYRFYGNKTLARIMGLSQNFGKKISSTEWYEFWYKRIDKNYINDVKKVIDNMIFMFDYKAVEYIIDEVCYVWHHDFKGKVNIRCGGKVIGKENDIYKIIGYHQDYTNILKLRDCIKNKNVLLSIKDLENINYLKEYYKELAYIDELTGIVNRRGFFDKINNIMENRMRRSFDNLWVTILDLDFFKKINDNFGHLSGDEVLKFIGKTLKCLENQYDRIYVFRYGGEEFIILLHQYTYEDVKFILNTLRKTIESSQVSISAGKSIRITCSMGVAYLKKDKNIGTKEIIYDGINRADVALYRAKHNGRNRIEFEL